ncbi:MAG: cupin domain-containing protein [Pirellulales bacterium]|nr:cupin domain-containing protein [Pirellulales bacterium]
MGAAIFSPDATSVVADWNDLVEATPDATVTKTLYDSPAARLVLFAMDAGQQLTDHSAAKPALVQVLDGTIEFDVSGAKHELRAGGWVAMPAGELHAVRAVEPARFLLTLLKGTF